MKSKPFGSLSGNEKGGDSLQAAGRLACPHGLHATRSVPLWRAANVSTRTLTLTSTLTKPRAEYVAQNGGLASQTLPLCTSLLFEGTIITMLIIVPAADRGARVRAEELATGVGLFLFRLAVSRSRGCSISARLWRLLFRPRRAVRRRNNPVEIQSLVLRSGAMDQDRFSSPGRIRYNCPTMEEM
ncbi:hypothetical protein ACNY67_04655 [Pantoea sp. KXB45]|uniref:hypothetical protein n=1 Tax=Pantoea sp. KXB45 TaxID=3402309 RepID=UPI003AB51013